MGEQSDRSNLQKFQNSLSLVSSLDLTFFVILGLDPRISIGNSRMPCVIARQQSDRSNLQKFQILSRIPYYVIPQLDWGFSSQRILEFPREFQIHLGNSSFLWVRGFLLSKIQNSLSLVSSTDLTFFVILGLDPRISIRNSRIPYVIAREQSDRSNLQAFQILSKILYYVIPQLDWRI